MADTPYFVPALDLLPYWPHDLLAPSDLPVLGRLSQYAGVIDFEVFDYGGYLTFAGVMAIWEELEIDLPLVEGFSLVLGKVGGGITEMPFELRFGQPTGLDDLSSSEIALSLFLKGYPPPYELVLPEFDIKLRVSRKYLKPMTPKDPAKPEDGFEDGPEDAQVEFVAQGELVINTETGVQLRGLDAIDFDYAQVGSTGLVIKAENVVIRLSEAQPLPDIEDPNFNLPADWTGLYFAKLSAYGLQEAWDELPPKLELTNWYLGKGGVSGKVAVEFKLEPDMSGQTFAMRTLQLALQQNTLVQALVQVAVKLTFWEDRILYLDIVVSNDPLLDYPASFGIQGSVGAEQPAGVALPPEGNLLELGLKSGSTIIFALRVTKLGVRSGPDRNRADKDPALAEDTRFFDIMMDGDIVLFSESGVGDSLFSVGATGIGMQLSPSFDIILPGGLWISVSEKVISTLKGLPISLTRVGFGREGDEKWIGLDAQLSLGSGTKFGAAVKGLRVYWADPADPRLELEGIELSLSRLPSYSIAGSLSITTESDPAGMAGGDDITFQGSAQIMIKALDLKMGGFLLFGRKDGDIFWYSAIEGVFQPGHPLPFGGAALLGATLLYGHDVAPNRQLSGDQGDAFNWFEHWYKPAPGPFQVIHSGKWQPAPDQSAFGIGATIGNIPDGRLWSFKALFVLLTPGPVLIMEGRLTLFKPPKGHKGPPESNVRGLIVLDGNDDSFLLAFEFDYKIPSSGLLIDTHAEGEIFYRGGSAPNDWYIALGWYEPISRRFHASFLRLFGADAYLIVSGRELTIADRLLSPTVFAIGLRAGFDKRWKLGRARAVLAAWISFDLAVSFNPRFMLGQVSLHGELSLKVFGLGFELLLDAQLVLEASEDEYSIAGEVEVRVGLPWPLPDISGCATFSFGDTALLPPPVDPLLEAASVAPGYPAPGEPIFRLDEPLDEIAQLPLDGRVVLNFARPMSSSWAGAPTPAPVAAPDQVGDVFYRYTVSDVRVRVEQSNGVFGDLTESLFGQWALGMGDQDGPNAESLILWGLTPFPYTGALGWPDRTERRSWADLLLRYYDEYPCGPALPPERCVDFNLIAAGDHDPELRYRPDTRLAPLVFTPFPDGDLLQELHVAWAEAVHAPLRIVDADGAGRCLRFARTTFIGSLDNANVTIRRRRLIVWGLVVELPASLRVAGFVDYSVDHYRLRVRALRNGLLVADTLLDTQAFKMSVLAPASFDRLELLLEPAPQLPAPVAGPPPCLREFCHTSVGLADSLLATAAIRDHWLHVFDAITTTDGAADETPGGALIHEPGTTYHIEVDMLTEAADSIDGPWTDKGTKTEQLAVDIGGAPADLSPYIEHLAPSNGERPVYADYDLRITYNRFYVETMYRKAGDALHAQLLDGMGNVVEAVAEPESSAEPGLTAELALYADLLADADCVPFDTTLVPGNDETRYVTRLGTSTPYEIRLFGGGHADPVHSWSFTTSRYRNFGEQVAFVRALPWDEQLPTAADIAALATHIAGATGVDRDAEFDLYLAAWGQDLALPLRTLPEQPEVSLLWEVGATSSDVRAIAIASPEPLLGERTIVRLIRREAGGILNEQPLALLRSRDGNRALLAPLNAAGAAIALAPGDYHLAFTYRLTGPGLTKISRAGSTDNETANWPFTVFVEPARLVDPEA